MIQRYPDGARKAMDTALRLLTVRARGEEELAERLAEKSFPAEEIQRTVDRLRSLGLLDDARLAQDLVDSRRRGGRGDGRIRREMSARRLPSSVVSAALALPSDRSGLERAEEALRRRVKRMAGLPPTTQYRRLNGFLLRQGFELEDVRRALRRFFSSESNKGDPFDEENL